MVHEDFAPPSLRQAYVNNAMMPGFAEAQEAFSAALCNLLSLGVIVTLETVPVPPLAMGNYIVRATYRKSNAIYRGKRK
jgi:hypothetical protein